MGWFFFCLWYLPMIVYYVQTQGDFIAYGFSQRLAEVNIFGLCKLAGNYDPLWDNIRQGLRSYTVLTGQDWITWFPFLDPWEAIGLLAGLAWCFWRFFKPVYFIVLLGFFGGMCCMVLSNMPTHANRALAGAPWVYLLVGIGLDRLSRMITAPLGKHGRVITFFFFAIIVVFSIGWHYDVYFNQMPKSWFVWNRDGKNFLAGKTLAHYPADWDLYLNGGVLQEYGQLFSSSKEKMAKAINFFPGTDLPLKQIPEKEALILLPDDLAKMYKDWICFYYPDSKPHLTETQFGYTEFWTWEITPKQVQEALSLRPCSLSEGLVLACYDSNNRKLKQWFMPALTPRVKDWFDVPGQNLSIDKSDYFIASGKVYLSGNDTLALETTGKVDWTVGNQTTRIFGKDLVRGQLKSHLKGWVPFKIRYQPIGGDYTLTLLRLDVEKWNWIPSVDLRP